MMTRNQFKEIFPIHNLGANNFIAIMILDASWTKHLGGMSVPPHTLDSIFFINLEGNI